MNEEIDNIDAILFKNQAERIALEWDNPNKVLEVLCPDCMHKTFYCQFRISIWLQNKELAFICPGMRTAIALDNEN